MSNNTSYILTLAAEIGGKMRHLHPTTLELWDRKDQAEKESSLAQLSSTSTSATTTAQLMYCVAGRKLRKWINLACTFILIPIYYSTAGNS